MRPVHTLFAAVLVATVVSSCWQPAFDPELSTSSLTSSKMTLVATITVTDVQQYWATPGIFLPRRVATPTDGIWLHGNGLAPHEFESTAALYLKANLPFIWPSTGFSPFKADQGGWPIARMSPASGDSILLEALAVETGDTSSGAVSINGFIDTYGSQSLSATSMILPGSGELLGAGFSTYSAIADSILMVYIDETSQEWMIAELPFPLPTPLTLTPLSMTKRAGFETARLAGVGFAAHKGEDYYLSVTDDGGLTTAFRWAGGLTGTPVKLDGVREPLVAVLNPAPDGTTLLSSNGMTMTVHNAAGEPLYSFPAGSLRFVHERYDAKMTPPRWMAVFCRTMFIRDQKDDRGTLRTEVFEIPVEDLHTLEN